MICEHCQTILHVCPKCGERGHWMKSRPTYNRYECSNGHRWNERDGEVIEVKRGRVPLFSDVEV